MALNTPDKVDALARLASQHRRITRAMAREILEVSEDAIDALINQLCSRGGFYYFDGTLFSMEPRAEDPISIRMRTNYLEKFSICGEFTRLIKPGDTVMVTAGTTSCILAQHLVRVPYLTVVSNSYVVASSFLAHANEGQAQLIGGEMYSGQLGTLGPVAEQYVRSIEMDWAVLSPIALSLEGELMYYETAEASFARAVIEKAKNLIVLCDSSKIGVISRYKAGDLSEVRGLITDNGCSPKMLERLKAAGMNECTTVELDDDGADGVVLLD
ncbi:DeoR/GlpR family DNA-binding transcription regulator [Pseudovibrio flavus]|uniref:DeoR/GlpR family DNA-binding transcription regulator n=1 Tax=Pseudovibrio flavus TaxID=2529854 RepID=UPI003527D005